MGLPKGMTNNPNGRKKGVPNKVSADLKKTIQSAIEQNFETLVKDLQALDSKDRLLVLERLLKYVLPTQSSVTAQVDMQALSDEQINEIINNINLQDNDTEN